jgi:predicted methyltransferase
MKEKEIYLLLNAIKKNTDIKRLIREGLSYSDIARLTKEAIKNELVDYQNDNIQLSEKGFELYEQLKDSYKRTNKDEWIEKDLKSQIPRIDKNTIFVPSQNELTF